MRTPITARRLLSICVLLPLGSAVYAQETPTPTPPPTPKFLFTELGALSQPQLAMREDGALALVFVGPKRTPYVAVREPNAEWSAPRPMSAEPDLAFGMRRGPRIAWAGDALVVSYIAARFDREQRKIIGSGNLSVRRSSDGGASWSSPLAVNGEAGSAAEGLHAMAARGDRVVLVWLDPRGEPKGTKLFAARSEDGGRSFGKDVAIYVSPSRSICECCHPSVALAATKDGAAVVLWRNQIDGDRDMYAGTLGARATRLAEVRACGKDHWKLAACPMDGGGLALGAEDLAISVWRREGDVYASFGAGEERLLGKGRNPAVAASGDRALAVWEGDRGLVFARLETKLETQGAPVEVVSHPLGAGAYASAVALPAARFLIVAERAGEPGIASWHIER